MCTSMENNTQQLVLYRSFSPTNVVLTTAVGRRLDGLTGGRDVNVGGSYRSTEASCGVLLRPTL